VSRHLLLLGLLALSLTTGCKRNRSLASAYNTDSTALTVRPDTIRSATEVGPAAAMLERLSRLNIRNAEFQTLAIKGSVRVETGGSSNRFSYRIHVERGKRIWAVVSLIGFEGARFLATPEGCQVIYRPDRKVFLDGYGKVRDQLGFNVDYALLEDVLLGNLRAENAFYARHWTDDPGTQLGLPGPPDLSLRQASTRVNYFMHSPPTCGCTRPGSIVVVDSNQGPSSRLDYDRWQTPENLLLPFLLSVDVLRPRPSRLVIEHREVLVNPAELTFSFAVPTDYEQVR